MEQPTRSFITQRIVAGRTNAQIAAEIVADNQVVSPVTMPVLSAHLVRTGIDDKLSNAVADQALPSQLRDGIKRLLRMMTLVVDAVRPEIVDDIIRLFRSCLSQGVITQVEFDGIIALAGGWLLDRMTAAQVGAIRNQISGETAALDLRNRITRAYTATLMQVTAYENAVRNGEAVVAPTWVEISATFQGTL